MKALIIQYSSIGDVLISTVVANNLKKIYPDIKIDFLCYRKYKGVLQKNPQIDRIIAVDSNRIYSLLFMYKYIRLVRSEKYDILIDMSVDFKSVFTTFFSKAKKKYGFHKPLTDIFYHSVIHPVSEPLTQTCNLLENRLVVLEEFLKDHTVPIDPQVKIYLTDEERSEAREIMLNAGIKFTRPVIMLGIFGSNKHNTWTLGSMAKLIDYLWTNYRADLLFNYLPSQYKQVNELLSLLNSNTKVFVQPVGKSVREYLAFMDNCTLFIGNDSRSVVTAKALQKPTFTIYPPYVYRKDVACYENTSLHQSVHLHDFLPGLYEDFYPSELCKDSSKFYLMLSSEFVILKIRPFLKEHLSTFNKIK
ncbi:glycosyltransferase family 9 protein [Apibacter sp. HY039]|uniref:glycosyltransferase family 9 protein n=1 Tax=Apibacter sp. HY039 TaxID=2501476 RepID=UPI000FEBE390|nr:glycosyltransferase family 9 protein [Apibacter sp. HY039]